MSTRRFPAGRFGIHAQRGWAWLSWAVPAAMKAVEAIGGANSSRKQMHEQMDMQREFAQNSLQWKAADARAAGLHPLAALGASGYSASPVSVGSTGFEGLGDLGQDIGRAILANSNAQQRDAYARKELAQFDAKRMSQEQEMRDLELEAARLRLQRLQQEVTNDAQGFAITPNQITAANPVLPSVAAGPAGPGFKATRIGNDTWDIGSSELSEWAEGAGLAGHALVPYWMWQQARARAMAERQATDDAHRGKDRAYDAALAEARRINGYVKRGRVNGVWGWVVEPKEKPFFNAQERSYWERHFKGKRAGASGSW